MADLRGRQADFNSSSRDHWDVFAEHRERVSALLRTVAAAGWSRLCVLGAGNSNDLDLPALLASHREVHLVDLDTDALTRGVAQQGVKDHPALNLHGGLDLTGMLETLSCWTPRAAVNPAELSALANWPADRVAPTLPCGFDHVASTCLLSQLKESARHTLGPDHPQLGEVERAIRTGHLRLLARLTAPGGRASLITEVVSSQTLPDLADVPEPELSALLPRLARGSNHFRGVLPTELVAALRDDPKLAGTVTGWELARPWRWRLHARLYLVAALTFRVGVGASGVLVR